MKVRIVRPHRGEIDDVQLELLQVGATYELSASLASLLICEGLAEPADGMFGRRERSGARRASTASDRREPHDRSGGTD